MLLRLGFKGQDVKELQTALGLSSYSGNFNAATLRQ